MPSKLISLLRFARACAFFVWSASLASVVVSVQLMTYPLVYFLDPQRVFYQILMTVLARAVVWPFMTVTVRDLDNLPRDRPFVMVINHQSAVDAFVLSWVTVVNIKSTFKKELLFYPGVGQALALTGHLWVKRGDRNSGVRLIERSQNYIRNGVSMLFFPEGTRKIDASKGPLGEFKAGAFKVASETGCDLLPVTISGARTLMPPRGVPSLGWGNPVVTVHPPIPTTGKDIGTLMEETRTAIASALRECDHLTPVTPAAGSPAKPAVDSKKDK